MIVISTQSCHSFKLCPLNRWLVYLTEYFSIFSNVSLNHSKSVFIMITADAVIDPETGGQKAVIFRRSTKYTTERKRVENKRKSVTWRNEDGAMTSELHCPSSCSILQSSFFCTRRNNSFIYFTYLLFSASRTFYFTYYLLLVCCIFASDLSYTCSNCHRSTVLKRASCSHVLILCDTLFIGALRVCRYLYLQLIAL